MLEFNLYNIIGWCTYWSMGFAVVSAENPHEAESLLKRDLVENKDSRLREGVASEFRVRGRIEDTGYKSTTKGVVYNSDRDTM